MAMLIYLAVFQIFQLKEIGVVGTVMLHFFKDNKFNRGRLDMVAHRDKDGKLRLGYPEPIPQEEIPF